MSSDAFEAGAGFEIQTLFLVIAGTGCIVAFMWAIWVGISAYKGWAKEKVDNDTFTLAVLKAVLLLVIFIWLFV